MDRTQADQRNAKTREGRHASQPGQVRHVDQERLCADQADDAQRGQAQQPVADAQRTIGAMPQASQAPDQAQSSASSIGAKIRLIEPGWKNWSHI